MQQDRIDGNISRDENALYEMLVASGAKNLVPPLPRSSYVKIIDGLSTGEVHCWTEYFASRPDLCVNCDEYGDTDPAKWRMPMAESVTMSVPKVLDPPPGMAFYFGDVDTGVVPGAVPQVQNAPQLLGIDPGFTQDYTDHTVTKAALPLPINSANVPVAELTKSIFDNWR